MTAFIADISSFQAGINLSLLVPEYSGIEIKCTQGATYVNPYYPTQLSGAHNAGLPAVAYHYVDGTDPASQAAWLKQHIIDTTLPIMLDAEKGAGDLPHVLAVADACTATGLRPLFIYLPRWYWLQIGSPDLLAPFGARGLYLINAAYPSSSSGTATQLYPGDTASGWNAYGGVTPTLWQFTSAAQAAGMKIDANAYRGDFATLIAPPQNPATAPHVSYSDPVPAFPGASLSYMAGKRVSSGTAVRSWQEQMVRRGWALVVDGKYGPQSAAVCRAFQRDSTAHGWALTVDGIVGPKTWVASFARPVSAS